MFLSTPDCIICATRSPQRADGNSPGALCVMARVNFRVVTWFITRCPPPSRSPTLTALVVPFLQTHRSWVTALRGANGPIHLSSIREDPSSPAARCHRAGSRRKRNPIGLQLNLGGLQRGDLVGEERARKATRGSGHAEFEVAAVTRERWGDRLGRGWSPPCS